ncbi:hypothetical protein ACNVED_14160 [Legionella sp. D16C41]|uniref:hypothetical protein n=1 Tax=Legionella sp. D16C41 TaxID=3402688 RepID=UPI003AF71E0E
MDITLKFSYAKSDKTLLLVGSHGADNRDSGNVMSMKLFFKSKLDIDLYKSEFVERFSHNVDLRDGINWQKSKALEKFHMDIQRWLTEQFKLIKSRVDNEGIEEVIFACDVNLGLPGEQIYPKFLLNSFIQEQFAACKVKKILFSSTNKVVADAKSKEIENGEVINSFNLLLNIKGYFKQSHSVKKEIERAPPLTKNFSIFKGNSFNSPQRNKSISPENTVGQGIKSVSNTTVDTDKGEKMDSKRKIADIDKDESPDKDENLLREKGKKQHTVKNTFSR